MTEDSNFLKALKASKEQDSLYVYKVSGNTILIRSRAKPNFRLRLTVKESDQQMKQAILKIFENEEGAKA